MPSVSDLLGAIIEGFVRLLGELMWIPPPAESASWWRRLLHFTFCFVLPLAVSVAILLFVIL